MGANERSRPHLRFHQSLKRDREQESLCQIAHKGRRQSKSDTPLVSMRPKCARHVMFRPAEAAIAHVASRGESLVPRGQKGAILICSAVSESLQFD